MNTPLPLDAASAHLNRVLVEAVAFLAAFLEVSDDQTVEPDAAVKQMENLGGILQQLTQLERVQLLRYIDELAARYQQDPGYEEFVRFLRFFGAGFALLEPQDDAAE